MLSKLHAHAGSLGLSVLRRSAHRRGVGKSFAPALAWAVRPLAAGVPAVAPEQAKSKSRVRLRFAVSQRMLIAQTNTSEQIPGEALAGLFAGNVAGIQMQVAMRGQSPHNIAVERTAFGCRSPLR